MTEKKMLGFHDILGNDMIKACKRERIASYALRACKLLAQQQSLKHQCAHWFAMTRKS